MKTIKKDWYLVGRRGTIGPGTREEIQYQLMRARSQSLHPGTAVHASVLPQRMRAVARPIIQEDES
jgi:hypothetical protein